MTAIMLNDGEIAALGPATCFLVFQGPGIAFKTGVGEGKNKFFRDYRARTCTLGSGPNPYDERLLRVCKNFLTNA
jgi:hypothetical protein